VWQAAMLAVIALVAYCWALDVKNELIRSDLKSQQQARC
jgi:hypothetical protein